MKEDKKLQKDEFVGLEEQFQENELKKVQECCQKYGYRAFLRFGEIHIHTTYESWYFIPKTNHFIKLMHGNYPGNCSDKWHAQFSRFGLSYEDLILYIHEHEMSKFGGQWLNFTFQFTTPSRAVG